MYECLKLYRIDSISRSVEAGARPPSGGKRARDTLPNMQRLVIEPSTRIHVQGAPVREWALQKKEVCHS